MAEENANDRDLNYQLHTTPVAIIGMASIFPKATNLPEYWDNILRKIDCITDVPPSRWAVDDYYDPNPNAPDKTYCKRGGFIPDIDFDPVEFGLPPNILEVTDVSQLLGLVVARDAMEDAGYGEGRSFSREHIGVILGVVGMGMKLFTPLMTRLQYPVWKKVLKSSGVSEEDAQRIVDKIKLAYVGWEENSFPGVIANVISGRIANRLDLGGTNFVTDAACGSSLAAIKLAVGELIQGKADMMISGGVDTDNSINTYMCFSKTPAFSKGEHVRSFDAESDGMMVGEGVGMVVLKRLADAERDGDRIYAVIKGVGSSSDGRFKSIYAPRPTGQAKALRRGYEEAGFSPATVGLIEAHGTGTMAGDPAEFQGLREVFSAEHADLQSVALGSVKSQIGHTKATAGAASLIKAALALYHKVLPPTINVTKPNPKLEIETTPFYLNTEARPWIRRPGGVPRRAGVSSFGFGGTNFHVVLEEYQADHQEPYRLNRVPQTVLLSAPDQGGLLKLCQDVFSKLQAATGLRAFTEQVNQSREAVIPGSDARLGFVVDTFTDALDYLKAAIDTLQEKPNAESWENPKGIYYQKSALEPGGKVVALFSGQGSQYVDMGRELANYFPPFRQTFGAMDDQFVTDGRKPLTKVIFPPPAFDPAHRDRQAEELQQTEYAQPAIGCFSVGLYKLLAEAGFKADFAAGHSFGELTALWAAGVLNEESYLALAKARGKAMAPLADPDFDAGTMIAVKGDVSKVKAELKDFPEVILANWNSNNQVALAGPKPVLGKLQQILSEKGFAVVPLQVSAAFHTPLVGHAQKPFAEAIHATPFEAPRIKVFSNSSGKQYSSDPQVIREVLSNHILNPVLFKDEVETIYAEGGYFFIEFGPKNVLTNLVKNILAGKPHVAVALNGSPKKDSDRQLREAVLQLRVAGLPLAGFDPYQPAMKFIEPKKKSAVTVTLNGGLYVSDKTRAAFEKTLVDGYKIHMNGNNGNGKEAHAAPALNNVSPLMSQPAVKSAPAPLPDLPKTLPSTISPVIQPSPAVMDSLEKSLAEFEEHQSETLRLHEQFLQNDAEYARIFANLTQMEVSLLSTENSGQMDKVLVALESLERSMMRFHDHQAETLRVHDTYLKSQAEFSQNFARLVQQQYGMMAGEAFTPIQPAVPGKPAAVPAAAPVRQPEKIVAVTAPAALSPARPAEVLKVEPVVLHPQVAATVKPVEAEAVVPNAPTLENISSALLEVVSEKTGYPIEMLDPSMDMEADLGIDSIKRVEILGAMQTRFPMLPKADPEALAEMRTLGQITQQLASALPQPVAGVRTAPPEAAPADLQPAAATGDSPLSLEEISAALLNVVSEKTGYPVEMLEPGMDMEADLGIDSIKRVEILGAMQALFPALPKIEPETLAELRTLGQITQHLGMAGQADRIAPAAIQPVEELVQPQVDQAHFQENLKLEDSLPSSETIGKAFLQVVSEKTGYPVEMLDLSMDMEADLGIDSIKRVEILGAMQTQFPGLPKVEPETLAELRTLGQVAGHLAGGKETAFPF